MPTDINDRWVRNDDDASSGTGGGIGMPADWREVDQLLRISDRLRLRSHNLQLAATRASATFRKAMLRSVEALGK